MMHLRGAAMFVTTAALAACADYATFVTATDIGITADVKTQEVSIGYSRTELFTGPGYPEQGEALQAVGFLASDLWPFAPHIKQLYATGDAAALVTQDVVSSVGQGQPANYYGQRRPLVFATSANIGLKIGFTGSTGPVPTSIKFGYNREEASVIPLREEAPTQANQDKYAPVLAAIDMNLATPSLSETKLALTQFFATGKAAKNLAARSDIKGIFASQASSAVEQAAVAEAVARSKLLRAKDYDTISSYFDKFLGTFDDARDRLITTAGLDDDEVVGAALKRMPSKEAFMDYLQRYPTIIPRLAPSAAKLAS